MKCIVLENNAGNITIKSLENNQIIRNSKIRGNIKKKIKINAGDYIDYDTTLDVISNIFDRKNEMIRPRISNVDNLFIIQSIVEPNINISQLFKCHTFYKILGIQNIYIILTKTDKLDPKILNEKIDELRNTYLFNCFDCHNKNDLEIIKTMISKSINCFVGQSGVGKSTLINKIIPGLNLKTSEISTALNRGKHTTTTSKLYENKDGYIVDTPGFSSIEISINNEQLAHTFFNFDKYYNMCKFNDCFHINEKGCYIKQLKDDKELLNDHIYEQYLKLYNETRNKGK